MSGSKPEPRMDPWNVPFWEACRERRLVAQRCRESGRVWLPPSPLSPESHSDAWDWVELSGRGSVWSFVVMHQKYFESYAEDLPYNVAQIELEEGAMMIANLVGVANDEIEIGADVELVWEERDNLTLPMFRPVVGSGESS